MRSFYKHVVFSWLFIVNSSAQTLEWDKEIKNDFLTRIVTTFVNSKGEIYALGAQNGPFSYQTRAKLFIDKYDSFGNLLWHRNDFDFCAPPNIACDAEENIYFGGQFFDYKGIDPVINGQTAAPGTYVIKVSPAGQVIWVSDNLGHSYPRVLFVSPDGSADLRSQTDGAPVRHRLDNTGHHVETKYNPTVLAGQYDRYGNAYQQYDAHIVKYDPSENILWKHPIYNGGTNFVVDPEGNVYVSEGGYSPLTVLYKLDPQGNLIWNTTFPGEFGYLPYVQGSNLYIKNTFADQVGSYAGFMIRRLNAITGESIWSWAYQDNRMNVDVLKARNGALYVAFSHMEAIKCKLTKLSDSAWIEEIPTAVSKTNLAQGLSVKPNPTMDKVLIESPDLPISTILVRDALGKQISSRKVERSLDGSVELDLSACPQGLYFVDVVLENNTRQACKIIRQ